MSDPFLGQVTIYSFGYAPRGWASCNGQLLPINQNQALFALLGTQYGGNGTTNFGLPNLQGSGALHPGSGIVQGQLGGEVNHTLSVAELPTHRHTLQTVTDFANAGVPGGALPAARARGGLALYGAGGSASSAMNSQSVAGAGGGQPHNNMQPYTVLNFCIALQGIFPSPN